MAKVLITEDYLSDIGDAIRGKLNVSSHYTPGQMASAIGRIPVVSPTLISKTILSNGTYNALEDEADGYDTVSVDVPNSYSAADEGKVVVSGALSIQGVLSVYSNSIYDTTLFSQVNVDVSQPVLVSKTITENGIYDPAEDNADAYSGVVVNVSGGGGGDFDYDYPYIITGNESIVTNAYQYPQKVSFPFCTQISDAAFQSKSSIKEADFPQCLEVKNNAFRGCSGLSAISFPKCSIISNYAFYSTSLINVSLPECSIVGSSAFATCLNLESINLPKCESLGSNAFSGCYKLSSISLPECITIEGGAFNSCSSVSMVSLPNCRNIQQNAFGGCISLSEVHLPKLSSLYGVFGSCPIESITLPECERIGNCRTLSMLKYISLKICSSIAQSTFQGCTSLESVYLLSTSVCFLGATAFDSTPMNDSSYLGYFGSIYVPQSLVDSYKIATRWSKIADRITSYVEE